MPWFKVDDNLAFHAKTVKAGNSAMGLWVRAGSWCAQNLTDGHVPEHIAKMLGTGPQAAKLVAAGLWNEEKGGFSFHEWNERQPKREAIESERAAARERMRLRREKKTGRLSGFPQVSEPSSPEVPRTGPDAFAHPDPTRPDPTHKREGGKRAHQLPEDFEPNDTNRRLADERGVDLAAVVAQFSDYHRAKGSTMKDWHLALNTWLRRERPAANASSPSETWSTATQVPPCPAEVSMDSDAYAAWLRDWNAGNPVPTADGTTARKAS